MTHLTPTIIIVARRHSQLLQGTFDQRQRADRENPVVWLQSLDGRRRRTKSRLELLKLVKKSFFIHHCLSAFAYTHKLSNQAPLDQLSAWLDAQHLVRGHNSFLRL